jgi:hypothetical protein
MFFLSIHLSLKTTHGCLFFHLLKSEYYTSFNLLNAEDNTRMFCPFT